MPQVALSYSSQGGDGPVGRGWAISGLSAIARCRGTREGGDLITGGIPVDGMPPAISFNAHDRYCLDGQRLLPAPSGAPACPPLSGFIVTNLRTQSESFQRVCAYTPGNNSANGPAFFSVERQDGSTSFYGDRNDWIASANRMDGYVNSTASGHQDKALSWRQTRFIDSTGNYIDFNYLKNPGGAARPGESLIDSIQYTGKKQLAGQTGGNLAPYAKLQFNYAILPGAEVVRASVAGGVAWQTRYLTSIAVIGDITSNQQARFYALDYATSPSGSGARTLISITECRDSTRSVCLAPTRFAWSGAINQYFTADSVAGSGFDGLVSLRLGDVDGDGITDVVWFKRGQGSGCNNKGQLYTSFGELDASGRLTFNRVNQSPWCNPRDINKIDDGWHLFDYDGDGRDDIFVAGAGTHWSLYPSRGRPVSGGQVFDFNNNMIANLSPGIPIIDYGSRTALVILADLNGDSLLDVVYPGDPNDFDVMYRARLAVRQGSAFRWGAEKSVIFQGATNHLRSFHGLYSEAPRIQVHDFDADSRSDVIFMVDKWIPRNGGDCQPVVHDREGREDRDGNGVEYTDQDTIWYEHPGLVTLDEDDSGRGQCELRNTYVEAMGVVEDRGNTLVFRPRKSWIMKYQTWNGSNVVLKTVIERISFADFNGDGLTDALTKVKNRGWSVGLMGGFAVESLTASIPNEQYLQLADVNGDGRADIVHPQQANSGYRPFMAFMARPDGTFPAASTAIPGGQARACKATSCDMTHTYFLFSDFDGDGAGDYVAIYDNSHEHYSSRAQPASRYQQRDAIVQIVDGIGAITRMHYRPLTLADVYRRGSGARSLNWGRGSPVQEVFGPQYVVVQAQSSAPVFGNRWGMGTIYYRYAGARIQAGGGGMLGYQQIQTFDTTAAAGQHVVTNTVYQQHAPFAGLPLETTRHVVRTPYNPNACVVGAVTQACFRAPGAGFPNIGGTRVSQNTNVWESAPAFAPGIQRPVHVRLAGTEERINALEGGAQLSQVNTAFSYDAYGFATATQVDTYGASSSSHVARVRTINAYTHITSPWRLGRLISSTVTHTRAGQSISRSTSYAYELGAPVTGMLSSERIQPGGPADQDVRTLHTLDAFGNRTHSYTCSNHLSDAACRSTAIHFHPSGAQVHRYVRTAYDARGRFPVANYSPYWSGSGSVEQADLQILGRNIFGDVTHARNAQGVDTQATYGALGRPWFTWTRTRPGGSTGSASAGVRSWTTWRWCGVGQLACPHDASVRQQIVTDGAPTQWNYHDVLGRVVLSVSQTRHLGQANRSFSGVCTAYDAAGRVERVSEPFFLPSQASATEPVGFAGSICASGRLWNRTVHDALGRVTQIQMADGTGSSMSYSGATTTTFDANGNWTRQTVNALGEVTASRDASGLSLSFFYTPDGKPSQVNRDAGRGAVSNTFGYDGLGRKIWQNNADSGNVHYQYNALGELVVQTDAQGNQIRNERDARGRIWQQQALRRSGSSHTQESLTQWTYDTVVRGALSADSITGQIGHQSHGYAYDSLGRLIQRDSTMDGLTYREQTHYDALGRAWKMRDASGHWVKQEYDARGFATRLCESSEGDTQPACGGQFYSAIEEVNERGAVTLERRGSSVGPTIQRSYNNLNGLLVGVCTGQGCTVQNLHYSHDNKGQIIRRELAGRYAERFAYDNADRLVQGWFEYSGGAWYGASRPVVNPNGTAPANLSFYAEYDRLGNICRKYAFGLFVQYGYGGPAGCGLGGTGGSAGHGGSAHQAQRLYVPGVVELNNTHDARGNMSSAGGARHYQYSVHNQATAIWRDSSASPTVRARFAYGVDGQRYRRIDDGRNAGGAITTTYIGAVERRQLPGGAVQWRRHIGDKVIVQYSSETRIGNIVQASGAGTVRHQFTDHQGTPQVIGLISGGSVTVQERLDTGPDGQWRMPDPPFGRPGSAWTTLGFTGHEHVEGLDTVHMNGRLYWISGGRFVQPDPVLTDPLNPQNWNPYSYVVNNPLNLVDPTGYSFVDTLIHPLRKAVRGLMRAAGPQVSGVVMGASCGTLPYGWGIVCAAGGGYDLARSFGANPSQARRSGVAAAFSAAVSWGLSYMGVDPSSARGVSISATAGGVSSVLQGGQFGHGFVSAGVTSYASPYINNVSSNPVAGATASAILGGTVSEMTGGKFRNGAMTGAFSYSIGRLMRGEQAGHSSPEDNRDLVALKKGEYRGMTEGEIDMVRDIFGDDINYSKVRIYNKRYGFIQRRGVAMAPDGNIYFHPSDYRDDFSILSIWDQGWFVHEITHVWQRQQGINVLRAAFNRKYDYSPLRAGKSFRSYGLEQQADIVRDYFLVKRGYRPYWGNHTIDEYEAILPFGR